ncbi:MAG: P-loop NTPase family protein, partial [Methanothrix sp.]
MDEKTDARDRSVAASEIINSIITTGNNSPVFVGRYERLRDAVIQPDEVFRRVHIESFVGRRWLIEQVDSILRDNSCGYLVLEAHAGLGKTAFLAWLVRERNYINHFVELAPGQDGIEQGLRNLAAQLIVAYELGVDEAMPDASGRPDYLYRLLSKAAEKQSPEEKIVIVVDALDEAGTPPNQNVLGLPKVLPEGVFFVVSMRPVQVTLQSDKSTTPRWPLKILAESNENLQDLRSFLKASAVWPKVARVLEDSEYTAEEFIDTLMKKSQGLWIYLHFVIPEIERGERSPLNLDRLPEGLPEYYASYWSRWRNKREWYDLYLPILTALAAAQESSTLDRIIYWAGIVAQGGERSRLRSILKEMWRPFLAVSGEGKKEKYRFYHTTVREFFEGKVEQKSLLEAERDLLNELSEATSEMHRMIAERCLVAWGGLEKGLPDLENKNGEDEGYGLRHLAAHLEASRQDAKLHCLLNLETRQGRNFWYEAKEAGGDTTGYINDIARAWRLAEEGYDPEDLEKTGQLIGLQNRYALIFASINSFSGNISPELLLAIVENGIWSKMEGVAHARHVPDLNRRSTILTRLSSLLMGPQSLDEALAVAREIKDKRWRARALAEIALRLQDDQKRD